MKRTRDLSIKKKLLLLQLIIVFIVLALAGVFSLLNDSRIYRRTISTKLSSMANILGYNCTSALEFRDNRDAALTLNSLKSETLVTHAWIMDATGRLFADYIRKGQGFKAPIGGEGDFEAVRNRALYLSRPIVKDKEILGTVILRYDLSRHRMILLQNALLAGLALLVGMAIALGLTVFSQRVIADPILRLADTIEHVSQTKDLSIRVARPGNDEIGVLYRGFNDMLAEIHNREQERDLATEEIRKLNESLERRVLERTRELAAANEKLMELDRLKSLFLASMSHELRTPLNSILGFTGLLLMGMSGPMNEEQIKQLTMVQNSSRHLLELINEVLDISKIESGRVDLAIEPFSITELAGETVKAVSPLAAAKGLELVTDIPKDLTLHSDRRRVKQVLVNLLGNAVKFSDRGRILIEVVEAGDGISIGVSDQGIGIRKENLQRLFSAFSQVDMTSTKRYEGTGLGLYLSRKILTLLGGTITVESEYGHGSRFTFTLPLTAKDGSHENGAHH